MVRIKSVYIWLVYIISLLGAVPVFFFVDPAVRFIFTAATLAGIFFDVRNRYHIRNIYLTILSAGLFIFFSFGFSSSNIVIPALNIVLMLLSTRLLGGKSERNCLQIVALSLFALAGSSLLDLSMAFFIYLLLLLFSIAVFLVIAAFGASGEERTVSRNEMKKILAVSISMPVLSFPLLIFFFVIIPRTQYPIWNFLNSPERKITGFSEKVQPGFAASVSEVKNVVFRAESPKLDVKSLYWRGIVMNTVQGNTWVRSDRESKENDSAGRGELIRQTIFLEPGTGNYILTLNVPERIEGIKAQKSGDCTFVSKYLQQRRLRYDSISVLTDTIMVRGGIDRMSYLGTPVRISPRVLNLARKISEKGKTDADKLASLKKYYISGKYSYANSNLPMSRDPIDEFLFEKKSGNCEYFAGSFALLLRLMGIPSRLVGGYYGGEYNSLGGYYLVTENMAHVWVEAFIDGRGWVTIDPSGFSGNFVPNVRWPGNNVLTRVQLLIDSMGYFWNRTVISYNLDKQFGLLRKTNDVVKRVNFKIFPGIIYIIIIPVMIFILYLVSRKKFRYKSKEERILRLFRNKIRKRYPETVMEPFTGLQELVETIDQPSVRRFADLYCGFVYRDRKMNSEDYRRLRRLLEQL